MNEIDQNCANAMISEHCELRKEINRYNDEIFKLENYGLIAIALLYSWFLANIDLIGFNDLEENKQNLDFQLLLTVVFPLLPLMVSVNIWLRLNAYAKRTSRIGMYIAELETKLCIPGWERTVWTSRFGFDPFTEEAALEFENAIKSGNCTKKLLPNKIKAIAKRNDECLFEGNMSSKHWVTYRDRTYHQIFTLQYQDFWKSMLRLWKAIIVFNLTMTMVVVINIFTNIQ